MDTKDFRLLVALHEPARSSYRSLGHRVSLSAPAVRDRIFRMEKRRILQGYWVYVDPAVFDREDYIVFFDGDWARDAVIKTLSAPDVAFAAWKLDGGVTVQLWPRNHKIPNRKLQEVLNAKPSGYAFSKRHDIPSPSLADWRIIDALIDDPLAPLSKLVQTTGLSPKTVRKHLRSLIEQEIIFIQPRLGSLADPGELVYHLAVRGSIGMKDLRRVLGDCFEVGSLDQPPAKYILCRADDLPDVTSRTQAARRLSGVESVRVTLNRELMPGNEFVRSLVRERIRENVGKQSTARV